MTRLRFFLLAFAWALLPIAARAAFLDGATEAYLTAKARAEGLTRALVVLDVAVSLGDMTSAAKRAEIAERKGQVLGALAPDEHVPEAVWDSELGQLSLLVNEAGLKRLAVTIGVRDVQVDMAEGQRLGVYNGDGRVAAIQRELVRSGSALVRIYYTDGGVVEQVIGVRQYYLLKEAREVKALVLVFNPPSQATRIDPRIMEAANGGQIALDVALVVPEHFSPMRSKLPPATWDAQVREFDATAARLAQEHGLPNVPSLLGMPVFGLVVTSEQARKLVAELTTTPDSQVYSVKLADLLQPLVGQSTVYIAIPDAWSAGVEASGQFVVVLDTGTDANHPFLAGDVIYAGCFGTDIDDPPGTPLWRGNCLNPDLSSNSPLPTPGAAAPCTSDPTSCRHGTHVAGIATGLNGTTRGQAAHGVARAASLLPIRIFSENVQTGAIGAFTSDVYESLGAIANSVQADAFTLNFSIGDPNFRSPGTCVDTSVSFAVDFLRDTWRIPTVAAAGNEASIGFTWPACVGAIVKVMSMCSINDPDGGFHGDCTVGQMSTTFTNYADPLLFDGPTFVAPGNNIYSSVPGGGFFLLSGTSMASPPVAGLYAAVKAAFPGISVAGATAWIQARAVDMTHPQLPGVTYKRIRVTVP